MRHSQFPTLAVVCTFAIVSASFAQSNRGGGGAAAGGIEPLTTVRVAGNLDHVVFATHAPGDYTRLFIVEKQGRIKILNTKTGIMNAQLFLDIDSLVGGGLGTTNEQGLLGLAFHPDYQKNGFFYVNYTNNAFSTTIRRFTVSADPDLADPDTGLPLLVIGQPFTNHNGGWIGFGPNDGYLYIATGDGGSACDPGQRAQDVTNQLLGKMLRIDVNANDAGNYGIPPSNPFVGITGDDEIWAYGLRNPWRSSFDRDTGDLYIADVGQFTWEEINFQPNDSAGGENYGWDCMEGNHCPPGCAVGACACFSPQLTDPIHEYAHPTGFAITGGYVYRGCAIPSLLGTYFFGDYASSRLWRFDYNGINVLNFADIYSELSPSDDGFSINRISSFGEDALGEIYIVDQGTGSSGEVFKIVPVTPTISPFDFDCDGTVGINDFLFLLASWGDCDGCLADVDGDHMVTISELLDLLASWG